MGTLQKWLLATTFLGGAYLVLTNPQGFAAFAGGVRSIVGGTVSDITRKH